MDLSLNTIVIAAIVLVVLVVIVLIFTGKMGTFVGGTKNCRALGGECAVGGCSSWAETNYGSGSIASQISEATEGCLPDQNCCKLIYNAPGGGR